MWIIQDYFGPLTSWCIMDPKMWYSYSPILLTNFYVRFSILAILVNNTLFIINVDLCLHSFL